MSVFQYLDFFGTFVFAISGALAAMNKKFDPFGVLILAAVTAIGGGSLRDVLIGRTPVGWMVHYEYAYVIIAATILAMLFRRRLSYFRKTMFLFDAIGLGIFTIVGVELSNNAGLHSIISVMLGTLSASFGGVIRDILCNQVPLIFHKEIYASISIIGGIVFLVMYNATISININYMITSSIVVVLRILAVRFNWVLPKFYKPLA